MNVSLYNKPWIWTAKPKPEAHIRLFCVPSAGSSSIAYSNWYETLPNDIELCIINLPGRIDSNVNDSFENLHAYVKEIYRTIHLDSSDKPIALFGHGMGALIAFELARLFDKNSDQNLIHLFVSGNSAPHLPKTNKSIEDFYDDQIGAYAQYDYNRYQDGAIFDQSSIAQMLIADLAMYDSYVYNNDHPIASSITAFGGMSDKDISEFQLESWNRCTINEFNHYLLPGGAEFINSAIYDMIKIISKKLLQHVFMMSA